MTIIYYRLFATFGGFVSDAANPPVETGFSTNLRTLFLADAVDPLECNIDERIAPASNISTLPIERELKTDSPISPLQFVADLSPSITTPFALSPSASFCSSINSLFSLGSVSDTKSPVTWRSKKYQVSSSAESSDSWVGVAGEGLSVSPRASTLSPATPPMNLEHHRSNQASPSTNHIDSNRCAELTSLDTSVDVAGEGSSVSPRASTLSPATPPMNLEHHRSNQASPSTNHIDSNRCAELTSLDTSVDVAGEGSSVSPRASTLSPAAPPMEIEHHVLSPVANIKDLVSIDIAAAEESHSVDDFSRAVDILMSCNWFDDWEVSSVSSEASAIKPAELAEAYEDSEGVARRVRDTALSLAGDTISSSSDGTVITVIGRQRSQIPRKIATDATVSVVRKPIDKKSDLSMHRKKMITAKCTVSEPETNNRLPAGDSEKQTTEANTTQTASKREEMLQFNGKKAVLSGRKIVGGRLKKNSTERNATIISKKAPLTSKSVKPVWRL